jgi:hypothetical protein
MHRILFELKELARFTPLRQSILFLRHRGISPADVFIASYPKSGSTWLRNILTTLLLSNNNEWKTVVERSMPYVGAHHQAPRLLPHNGRLIKTHEMFRPEYQKAIILVRDARDVAVSQYYYTRRIRGVTVDAAQAKKEFPAFSSRFINGKACPYGSWQKNVISWLDAAAADPLNYLVIRYEDMQASPLETVIKVTAFLQLTYSPETLQAALDQNNLEAMRNREKNAKIRLPNSGIPFVRKGTVGDWKEYFTPEAESTFLNATRAAMRAAGYPE